jgi:DNA repair exonuclease SbcCD ATPase subunit
VDSETKTLEQNISKASEQEQTILQVQKQLANFEFWVKKFPLVRLTILNEVVEELEIHFNQSFSAMGLYDWSVKLSTERQLKDESTKIELTMTLLKGDQEISIASLSGGERQRIRLCVNLGISDLIKSRCGASWDIVLLDEPCASMSQEGIDHLLSLLSALSEQMIVMLAEHRVMDSARFKGIYTLVKNTDQMTDLVKV